MPTVRPAQASQDQAPADSVLCCRSSQPPRGVVCHSPSLSSLQCEHLVGLLLDTAVVSMPSSGGSQRNIISFSHGQYFYSLFSETINTELLKNLDVAVLELMKSSVDNPKMVMDFSFYNTVYFL